jgi:hypothetical protein
MEIFHISISNGRRQQQQQPTVEQVALADNIKNNNQKLIVML